MMPLANAQIHNRYKVVSSKLPEKIQKRLLALGMTSGTEIEIVNAKGKGILVIKLRGTRFALGKNITKNIEVEPVYGQ